MGGTPSPSRAPSHTQQWAQAIFSVCTLSGCAPPAHTIVFLQPDLAVRVLREPRHGANGAFSSLVFWETQICPTQHLSPSLAAVMCPGKWTQPSLEGINKACCRQDTLLAGDLCSADWQFSPMEWSRGNSLGLINCNSSFSSRMGRGKKRARNRKKIKIQLTSLYYLSLSNVHSRVPLEIFQMIFYLSWLTNVSFDLV